MIGQPKVIGVRVLATLVAALLVASGCGGKREALTIYSGRTENLVGPLLQKFSRKKNIAINVRYGDSSDLALLISEEGKSSPADVFFSQSPGAVGLLAGQKLLVELGAAQLGKVPEAFQGGNGFWVGVSARQRVLVYNSNLVKHSDLPKSVFDLSGTRYKAMVAVAPNNASFQDFITAMRAIKGDEVTRRWLKGLESNGAEAYPNNNAIVAAVARGEIPLGLVNHYYNYRFLKEDPNAPSKNYVFPAGDIGSMVLASSVTTLRSSKRSRDAAEFINYLLSPEAQEYFAEETFEYPLAKGSKPSAGIPPLDASRAVSFELDRLAAGLKETTRLIQESGLAR